MQKIPLKGLRGMIASNMMQSLQQAAQLTFVTDVDATGLLSLKAQFKREKKVAIGVEDLLILCLKETLKRHGGMNGYIADGVIHLSEAINVAIATPIPGGLAAPVLFDIQEMSIEEISAQRRDLIARANSNHLFPREMTGGTITISNLGLTRVKYFTPILNAGQLAILGIGSIQRQPVCLDSGEIVVRSMMGLSLTCDHQAIDGQPAGEFLSDLAMAIEKLGAGGELHIASDNT
ncbi:2-oxo acid dehydrogenase subunit E2 [Shewanella corallii]|uniref:2-oxo acid dehydrogenase subunit E2 n=1 Tax=Shewanella corallii TaxID=560080 RepID=A0ABT0NAK8_9GAMM|nr:2-oxo acid dehydrogenase subunit E2 [Shewanella corallii]MCL2915493.1 2-oxo acid dehydrogenase subunit E2 [Shewanella corallii]